MVKHDGGTSLLDYHARPSDLCLVKKILYFWSYMVVELAGSTISIFSNLIFGNRALGSDTTHHASHSTLLTTIIVYYYHHLFQFLMTSDHDNATHLSFFGLN